MTGRPQPTLPNHRENKKPTAQGKIFKPTPLAHLVFPDTQPNIKNKEPSPPPRTFGHLNKITLDFSTKLLVNIMLNFAL